MAKAGDTLAGAARAQEESFMQTVQEVSGLGRDAASQATEAVLHLQREPAKDPVTAVDDHRDAAPSVGHRSIERTRSGQRRCEYSSASGVARPHNVSSFSGCSWNQRVRL